MAGVITHGQQQTAPPPQPPAQPAQPAAPSTPPPSTTSQPPAQPTFRVGATFVRVDAFVTKDGEPVGTVTSPSASPRLGTIGLAILRSDAATDGEKVDVAVEGGTAPATVDVLSLYDPQKQKPRG
jgi:glycine cleavage system aminomethyltransferase T